MSKHVKNTPLHEMIHVLRVCQVIGMIDDMNKLHGIHVFFRTNIFLYSLFFTYLIIEKKHVKHVKWMKSKTNQNVASFENMKKTCKLHVMGFLMGIYLIIGG
jgi:hypothetical protein